jgi:predicted nucleic acid-binding protein
MIAVDTNILARLLLRDDETQYRKAIALFSDGRDYTAPPTVILELAWVLHGYGAARREIADGLKALLGLPNFKPGAKAELIAALELFDQGLDFADAFHLALCGGETTFLTFDNRFAKRADKLGSTPPVQLV